MIKYWGEKIDVPKVKNSIAKLLLATTVLAYREKKNVSSVQRYYFVEKKIVFNKPILDISNNQFLHSISAAYYKPHFKHQVFAFYCWTFVTLTQPNDDGGVYEHCHHLTSIRPHGHCISRWLIVSTEYRFQYNFLFYATWLSIISTDFYVEIVAVNRNWRYNTK